VAALTWGGEPPKDQKGTEPTPATAAEAPAAAEPTGKPAPAVVAEPGKTVEPLKAPVAGQGAVPNEEPPAARPILMNKREITAQLQIFLDQQLFSPGMIDGNSGKFLSMALKRWQKAHGLPETGQLDKNVPYDKIWPVYTMHTVEKVDFKHIGDLPGKTAEQATRKYLPYSSYLEFVAERYHSSPEFLQKLNPGLKFDTVKIGDQIRVPNVEPFKLEEIPDTGNLPDVEAYKTRKIVISRRDTIFELYDGDKLIASIPIAPGSPAHPTPQGHWKILGVSTMPTFRWDAGVLSRGVRTSNFYMLPSGPNNPVGVGWIGLNKPGIGIHGTNNPYSIGTWASHGCMRSGNWDIARVSRMVTRGMEVEIQ
jgi:lipoprotein-anchoring transpeptidase ErfK/SrfK